MQVQSLGWEDPLEEEMETCSSTVFLPGKSHRQRSLEGYSLQGYKESDITEWLNTNACLFQELSVLHISLGLGSSLPSSQCMTQSPNLILQFAFSEHIWYHCVSWIFWELDTRMMFSSVQFSCSVMSESLRPHESQHARSPCPSKTPRAYSNSCPSSQ